MKMRQVCRAAVCAGMWLAGAMGAWAQTAAVRSRVVDTVDDSVTVRMKGNVHPLAKPAFDQGALPDGQPVTHMLMLLQRAPEQELALRQLLDAQLTKNSGSYHAWLTPAQFGTEFGPSDADVQQVTNWLTRQGFQVNKVSNGKTLVDFSGNAGQVRNAFHTEIHRYVVNGEEHFANASDPAIPQALAPVVSGIAALHNFPKQPQIRKAGNFQRDGATGEIKPLFTYTDTTGTFYAVGPQDFATIYNIPITATGAGQSIAIVGQSNINVADVTSFRSMFGLPAYPQSCATPARSGCLNVIVNGPDPGIIGPNTLVNGAFPDDEIEADTDVQWAGAVAPQAQIIFVTSETTDVTATQGIDLSAAYIIDNNIAPVMSESYGNCELNLLTGGNQLYYALWQQAAAQGITVVIAAGDSGSAACDPSSDPNAATTGIAVSGIASTPFNVAVGGTDFNQTAATAVNYWNTSNSASTQLTAKGYIPEVVWDNSKCAANYLASQAPCTSVDPAANDITAAGGGPSNCVISNGSLPCTTNNNSFPNGGYPKPAFQTGLTPGDLVRDIPDVSLFASNGFNHSFYIVCQSDSNLNNAACNLTTSSTTTPQDENFVGVGGTSAATPSFAGIMALINAQDLASGGTGRQGNANYVLYALAASEPNPSSCNSNNFITAGTPIPSTCVFYDITTGTNSVACDAGSLNCSNTTAGGGFGVLVSGNGAYTVGGVNGGNPAFRAVTGYDLATGLGTVNVGNLLSAWSSAHRTVTTTTLNSTSTTNTSGSNFAFSGTVSPTPPNGEAIALNAYSAANGGGTLLGSVGSDINGNNFVLTAGAFSATTNSLPPGAASIVATYGGDATLGASTSTAYNVTVSGANQGSATTLNYVSFNSSNCANGCITTSSQSNVPYGSPYILNIIVGKSSSSAPCIGTSVSAAFPCPVGTITLTDNGNPLLDFSQAQNANATNIAKLNNQGQAEDQYIQLGVGNHSLVAAFTSTNANYQNSSSNTLGITITKASTVLVVGSSVTSITPGASVTLTAYVTTQSSGVGPTGSVAFSNGSTSLGSATCNPTSGQADITSPITQITVGTAYCTATLTTTNIGGLYPPAGGPGTPAIPRVPVILALLSLLLFVLGLRLVPQARRRAYTYAGLLVIALLVGVVAGCGGGGSNSGGGTAPGLRTLTVSYGGDTNYSSAPSATLQIQVQ